MQRAVGRDAGHAGHGEHRHDACDAGAPASRHVLTPAPGTTTTTYRVDELDCATEERELRDALTPIDSVR